MAGQNHSQCRDVLGNLKSVTLPSTDVVSYEADLYGRRAYRKFNGTITSRYFYDGGRLRAELDSARQFKAVFVYASKSHVPDYMIAGGDKYRIVTDHLGSVRLVVKVSDGTVAQEIEYNELGKVLSDTNPGFQPFGFAGGLYDPATGLVRFGARDYDSETGRWTSKDPILFKGGDANLYGYVLADPINKIDPKGTDWSDINWGNVGGGLGLTVGGALLTGYSPVLGPAAPIGTWTGIGAMFGEAILLREEWNNFKNGPGYGRCETIERWL